MRLELISSALEGAVRDFRFTFPENASYEWPAHLHEVITNDISELVLSESRKAVFKWYATLIIVFHKAVNPEVTTDPPVYLRTHPVVSYAGNLDERLKETIESLKEQIDNYERSGSGWIVKQLVSLDVSLVEMENPLYANDIGNDTDSDVETKNPAYVSDIGSGTDNEEN